MQWSRRLECGVYRWWRPPAWVPAASAGRAVLWRSDSQRWGTWCRIRWSAASRGRKRRRRWSPVTCLTHSTCPGGGELWSGTSRSPLTRASRYHNTANSSQWSRNEPQNASTTQRHRSASHVPHMSRRAPNHVSLEPGALPRIRLRPSLLTSRWRGGLAIRGQETAFWLLVVLVMVMERWKRLAPGKVSKEHLISATHAAFLHFCIWKSDVRKGKFTSRNENEISNTCQSKSVCLPVIYFCETQKETFRRMRCIMLQTFICEETGLWFVWLLL